MGAAETAFTRPELHPRLCPFSALRRYALPILCYPAAALRRRDDPSLVPRECAAVRSDVPGERSCEAGPQSTRHVRCRPLTASRRSEPGPELNGSHGRSHAGATAGAMPEPRPEPCRSHGRSHGRSHARATPEPRPEPRRNHAGVTAGATPEPCRSHGRSHGRSHTGATPEPRPESWPESGSKLYKRKSDPLWNLVGAASKP